MTDTPALRALAETDLEYRVVRTERARSAEESARFQGIPLGALLRTLVVRRGEDDYLFVLVPGGRKFDWAKLRDLLGVRRMTMPDAEEAKEVTGYERGAITPFGARRSLPVIIDSSALGQPVVAIGGGAHGVNVHLSPHALAEHLEAQVAEISVPEEQP
ncbi:MAG TPA: YbaK/EbsC family protein [Acidimicrobiia bacterium]